VAPPHLTVSSRSPLTDGRSGLPQQAPPAAPAACPPLSTHSATHVCPSGGALMSVPAPGGGLEPGATPAPPAVGEGVDSSPSPPLLDLLERFPDLFLKEVLERLDPTDRASLARTGSAFLDVVYPRTIFPLGLPPAQMTALGRGLPAFTSQLNLSRFGHTSLYPPVY